jgi:hypothetical protein
MSPIAICPSRNWAEGRMGIAWRAANFPQFPERSGSMIRATRTALVAASGAIALSMWSGAANAQSNEPWRFQVTPYGWLAGLTGRVGVRRLTTDVDLSVGDVLDALQFAAMLNGEARKGHWVVGFDAIYVSLGDAKSFLIRGDTGSIGLTLRETIIQPVGGYQFGDPNWGVDVLVGFRYWNLRADLDVDPAVRPSGPHEHSGSINWVDATGGARAHFVYPAWHTRFILGADGGGGGSHDTWQVYGSAGYNLSSMWTVGLGYRILGVNYDRDELLNVTRMKGFLLFGTYRF